jgi:hypothetical protein
MKNDKADKITEELFRQNSHKTTKQTLESLESNKYFQKDISDLRIKWSDLIQKFNLHYDEMTKIMNRATFDKIKLPKIEKEKDVLPVMADLENKMKHLSSKEQKKLAMPTEKALLVLANRDFTNDIIEVCKKYKLSPIEIWLPQIRTYITTGHLLPPDFLLTAGLSDYFSKDDIIHAPQDLNFIPRIEKNPATGEKKLVVDFLDNTTIKQDLKKHSGLIAKIQKLLRREKGVKRFYPVKTMPEIEKLAELDKQKTETYYEPLSGKQITTKTTDVYKALKIYEDIPFGKKEEIKAGNKIKQIRHRNKKRFL